MSSGPPPPTPAQVSRAELRTDLRTAIVTYLACVLLLAVDLTGLSVDGPFADLSRWWHLLPLTAGCALMLVKRQRPILAVVGGVALVGVDLLLGGSLGTLFVFVDLLYAAGLYASPSARRALTGVVGAVVLALVVATGVANSGDLQMIIGAALQGLAVLGLPLWWAADVRHKGDLAALANEREALARAHAADLTRIADLRRRDAVQAERRAMARDLHDVVAGHVSAVAIRTGAVLTLPDVAPRERETLEFVRASSLTTLAEMRTMILLLRGGAAEAGGPRVDGGGGGSGGPEQMASPGRIGDLPDLVGSHRAGGLDVTFTMDGAGDTSDTGGAAHAGLPVAVDQAAFRVVQEALTNAVKHGGPGPVCVGVRASAGALTLSVTNPLPAAPAPTETVASAGIGLATMRERAEGLGGTFDAGPTLGTGPAVGAGPALNAAPTGPAWRVQATFPLQEHP